MKIKEILEGWRNHLIPPSDIRDKIEEVSKQRLSICRGCEFNSENAKKNGYVTMRPDEFCVSCGCPLITKTKCLSCECPLKKWLALATDEEDSEIDKIINE